MNLDQFTRAKQVLDLAKAEQKARAMLQGTDEWRQARCGSIGASDAPRVVRRTKTGYSADRDSLMAEKVLERLTDTPFEKYKTAAMLRGMEREPEARLIYQLMRGVEVMEVALFPHLTIKGTHASPDGLVLAPGATEAQGLIEIKCPEPAKHLDTLLTETISNDHNVQMMWQLSCTGARLGGLRFVQPRLSAAHADVDQARASRRGADRRA